MTTLTPANAEIPAGANVDSAQATIGQPTLPGCEEWEGSSMGLSLRGLRWERKDCSMNVVALHGWLDNANTMAQIAPFLHGEHGADVLSLDMPGHGKSQHFPSFASYTFVDYVRLIGEVLKQRHETLGKRVTLVGHSMGGGVCGMLASTFPDHVERLVMLEGMAPITSSGHKFTQELRRHYDEASVLWSKRPRSYASKQQVVERLMASHTGKLDQQQASILADRGTQIVANGDVEFRHDPKLRITTGLRFTPTHVASYYKCIECPTCIIAAEDGWPVPEGFVEEALTHFQNVEYTKLPGGHHFHLHSEESKSVMSTISRWLHNSSVAIGSESQASSTGETKAGDQTPAQTESKMAAKL